MSYDDILDVVKGNGPFQMILLFLLGTGLITSAVNTMAPIFIAHKRNFWCSKWGNSSTAAGLCSPPNSLNWNSTPDLELSQEFMKCPHDKIIFDTSMIYSTIQSQYGLICGREYLVGLTTSFYMLGFTLGFVLYGHLSDKFGRIKMISVAGTNCVIAGLLTAFAPNIFLFGCGRFLLGIGCTGLMNIATIAFAEFTSPKFRFVWQMIFLKMWIAGLLLVSLIGFLIRNHFYFQIAGGLLALINCTFFLYLPESPRWLLAHNRVDEAFRSTRTIAWWNRRVITREQFDTLLELNSLLPEKEKIIEEEDGSQKKCSLIRIFPFLMLFTLPNLLKTSIITWLSFFCTMFVYFALSFSSGDLGGNLYINFFVMSLVEIPGRILAIFLGFYFGRVVLLSGFSAFGSVVCFIAAVFYKVAGYEIIAIALSITARFVISTMFSVVCVYSLEVYPTVIRNSAVGVANTIARLGGMLAPQIIQLDQIWRPLPFLIYGVTALLSSIFSLLLPETKGRPTLETVDQGENFAKRNKIWQKKSTEEYMKKLKA